MKGEMKKNLPTDTNIVNKKSCLGLPGLYTKRKWKKASLRKWDLSGGLQAEKGIAR